MKKKNLKRWIWLGVSTLILALIIYNLRHNPEWAHFDWGRLWASLVSARPGLLLLALVGVYGTYVFRALRWQFLMHPIKKGSLWVLIVGQLLGFSSIYLVGRPGEFVRHRGFSVSARKLSRLYTTAQWTTPRCLQSPACS